MGPRLQVLTGVDDHSRFCVSATVLVRPTARPVCRAFAAAMRTHGVPEQVLTDNGKVFTGRFGKGTGEVLFDRICRENGIRHLLTAPRSRALSGMLDTSDWEGGPRDELFEAFAGAHDAFRRPADEDFLDQPAYRFWFLLRGDDPRVAVESDSGRCWWRDGTEHNLYEDYVANGRRLSATAARCLAPAVR